MCGTCVKDSFGAQNLAFCGITRMLCDMTGRSGDPPSGHEGWTVDDSEFAARLALVRWKMRWNTKEAARQCDLPAASWASWEGGSMPRRYTDICHQIANATGADYLWLVTGSRATIPPHRPADQSRPRDNRPTTMSGSRGPRKSVVRPSPRAA
jgi:hypothetical protein